MKNIFELKIDTSDIPASVNTRNFSVIGEKDAEFTIYILQNDTIKFYDFDSKTFALGHNSKNNNLKIKLKNNSYNSNVVFPSGTATYTIKLETHEGTEVKGTNKNIISKSIDKLASDATVTFKAATANTSNYATFPTTTSTGAYNDIKTFDFDWDIVNASTDSHGFGLRIPDADNAKSIASSYWYFTVTDTVDGAISPTDANSGLKVIVDDTTDISAGMIITGVSSGSLSGEPYILSVDTETKTLTMSEAQTFADGITLTFRAEGSAAIKTAIGLDVEFVQYPTVTPEVLKKVVRAGSSSTTINLNGTYGIAGGGIAAISGLNIDNTAENLVASVSASSSAGSIVVEASQSDLITNTTLTFSNTHQTINIIGTINITKFPTANRTVYLDIDKFIAVGAAS
jgi:hypothetical protein